MVDVREAVFRLGFYEVYRMAVALFGQQSMAQAKARSGINVEELWRHSAIAAVAAAALAREVGESEGLAFTTGLLHDIGKIVFASGEDRLRNWRSVHALPIHRFMKSNKARTGFGHGEVGALPAGALGLAGGDFHARELSS